jgi:hypothetical protein
MSKLLFYDLFRIRYKSENKSFLINVIPSKCTATYLDISPVFLHFAIKLSSLFVLKRLMLLRPSLFFPYFFFDFYDVFLG